MRVIALVALAPIWLEGTVAAQPAPSFHNCVRNFVTQFNTSSTKANFSEISQAAASNCEGSLNIEVQNERTKTYQFLKNDQNPAKSTSIAAEIYLQNFKADRRNSEIGFAISELISKKVNP